MSLRDAMRKASGLIFVSSEPAPPDGDDSDLDDILARVDRAAGQPVAGGTGEPFGSGGNTTTKTAEEIVRDSAGPNLDEIQPATLPADTAPSDIQPKQIYESAGLPAAPFSAEQMLEMLASLPSELPLDTKRQTVKVTLSALGKTMGATPETIVADASRKLAALNAYIEHLSKQTDGFVAKSEHEIAALQAQIEDRRKAILGAKQSLVQLTQMCTDESHRLDDVLEFFSLDVPPSKYAAAAAPAGTPATPAPAPAPAAATGTAPVHDWNR